VDHGLRYARAGTVLLCAERVSGGRQPRALSNTHRALGAARAAIFPALAAETLLSAFLIGPLVTTFGPVRYFSDPTFWSYLGNMIDHVQFDLPGVFLTNPTPGIVNRQLWTVPYELYCYLALSAVALLGRQWIKLNVSVVIAAMIAYVLGHLSKRDDIIHLLANFQLVLCFLIGVALFFVSAMRSVVASHRRHRRLIESPALQLRSHLFAAGAALLRKPLLQR
jgi:peptidoglycan/LPS O-acetylase OafA/YrhL